MHAGSTPRNGELVGQRIVRPADDAAHAQPAPQKPKPLRRIRAVHLLIVCGLLLGVAVVAGAAGMLVDLRDRALAASERELANTALVLAEQTDRAFQAVELMESGLIESLNARGIASAADYERLMSGHDVHLMLKDKISGLPHVGAVVLVGADLSLIHI